MSMSMSMSMMYHSDLKFTVYQVVVFQDNLMR